LRDFWGDFLHYILNSFWAIGQWQAEVLEEDGEAGFGTADDAKAEILAGARGQNDIHRANLGHFFEQFPRGGSQAARCHPVLKRPPQGQRQEARQDVRLRSVLFVVENGPKHEVVFFDAAKTSAFTSATPPPTPHLESLRKRVFCTTRSFRNSPPTKSTSCATTPAQKRLHPTTYCGKWLRALIGLPAV
jgi:hypothetical protein